MTTTPGDAILGPDPAVDLDPLTATSGPGSQPADLDEDQAGDDPAALRRESIRRRVWLRELEAERDAAVADRDRLVARVRVAQVREVERAATRRGADHFSAPAVRLALNPGLTGLCQPRVSFRWRWAARARSSTCSVAMRSASCRSGYSMVLT